MVRGGEKMHKLLVFALAVFLISIPAVEYARAQECASQWVIDACYVGCETAFWTCDAGCVTCDVGCRDEQNHTHPCTVSDLRGLCGRRRELECRIRIETPLCSVQLAAGVLGEASFAACSAATFPSALGHGTN